MNKDFELVCDHLVFIDKHCDNCSYSLRSEIGDLVCVNVESDFCADFVADKNCCRKWELGNG